MKKDKLILPTRENNPNFKQQYLEFFSQLRREISNILYQDAVFKQIIEQYDSGAKQETMANAAMAILNRLTEMIGAVDLPTMFAAGMTVFNDLSMDLVATGRKPLEQNELDNVAKQVMARYLQLHKDQYDPIQLKEYLSELQQKSQSGELQEMMMRTVKETNEAFSKNKNMKSLLTASKG